MNRLTLGETHSERGKNEAESAGIERMRLAVIALLESALDRQSDLQKIIDAVSELDP